MKLPEAPGVSLRSNEVDGDEPPQSLGGPFRHGRGNIANDNELIERPTGEVSRTYVLSVLEYRDPGQIEDIQREYEISGDDDQAMPLGAVEPNQFASNFDDLGAYNSVACGVLADICHIVGCCGGRAIVRSAHSFAPGSARGPLGLELQLGVGIIVLRTHGGIESKVELAVEKLSIDRTRGGVATVFGVKLTQHEQERWITRLSRQSLHDNPEALFTRLGVKQRQKAEKPGRVRKLRGFAYHEPQGIHDGKSRLFRQL